jgi:hypothetical protein
LDQHGRFRRLPDILSAETDQGAIAQADQMVKGSDVELWQGERLVTS